MNSNPTDFVELRATLNAMMKNSARLRFAQAMMNFFELGLISEIGYHTQPMRYMVKGVSSLDDVDHIIGTVENPLHVALLELSVLGQVSFGLEKANLRFFAIESVA